MANKYLDTAIIDKAIIFATNKHHNSERRDKGTPYIIHPLEAMSIVATITKDPEIIAASVLHDTIEDTDTTFEEIEKEFGTRVANIVKKETVFDDGTKPWRERKSNSINNVKNGSIESKIVALGDKLSNLRAIHMDYIDIGDKLWERFHCKNKKDVEWYYRSMAESLIELKDTHAYKEYIELLDKTFK